MSGATMIWLATRRHQSPKGVPQRHRIDREAAGNGDGRWAMAAAERELAVDAAEHRYGIAGIHPGC
jgi:hypothetical protein